MNTCGNTLLWVSSLLSDSSGNLSLVAVDFTLPVHHLVMLALWLSYTPNFLTHHLISEHSPVGMSSLLKLYLIPGSLDSTFDISSFNQTILLLVTIPQEFILPAHFAHLSTSPHCNWEVDFKVLQGIMSFMWRGRLATLWHTYSQSLPYVAVES